MPTIFNEVNIDEKPTDEQILETVKTALKDGAGILVVTSRQDAVCACGRPGCKDGASEEIIMRDLNERDIAMAAYHMVHWSPMHTQEFFKMMMTGVSRDTRQQTKQ